MSNMMLQNIGVTGKATLLAMARQGLTFIPAVLILPALLSTLGGEALLGIELAQPVADVLSLALAIPISAGEIRSMQKAWEERRIL
jgi:hypothetical protein